MTTFIQQSDSPFGLSDVEKTSTPIFADTEGDGDLDAGSPNFAAPVTNPFGLVNAGVDGNLSYSCCDRVDTE